MIFEGQPFYMLLLFIRYVLSIEFVIQIYTDAIAKKLFLKRFQNKIIGFEILKKK